MNKLAFGDQETLELLQNAFNQIDKTCFLGNTLYLHIHFYKQINDVDSHPVFLCIFKNISIDSPVLLPVKI